MTDKDDRLAEIPHGDVCRTHGLAVLVVHVNDGEPCTDYLLSLLAAPPLQDQVEVFRQRLLKEVRKNGIHHIDCKGNAEQQGPMRVECSCFLAPTIHLIQSTHAGSPRTQEGDLWQSEPELRRALGLCRAALKSLPKDALGRDEQGGWFYRDELLDHVERVLGSPLPANEGGK